LAENTPRFDHDAELVRIEDAGCDWATPREYQSRKIDPRIRDAENGVDDFTHYQSVAEAEVEEPDARAAASKATGSWFVMAMSKAAPSKCFDRVAPPTARLCFGLR
jgi:hypothetical protein